ncbi:hypothetical protein GCM10025868_06970 [Angustibacter aerolatus]|uniref:Uncharacterized protein n=1 Tax=Angustibacter aerolatus TaxID=1162965 RepID=A0ABQ6JCE8_9ACTN|nr:hypothetical protein GCM10025868_06970 [Angustibacter aerolatus]
MFDVAQRLLDQSEHDVMWVGDDQRRGPVLHVAPIRVAGILRERLYGDRTVVLTSATLEARRRLRVGRPQRGSRRA